MVEPEAPPEPEDAEIKRGVGSGEQLIMGEAAMANEGLELAQQFDQTGIPQGVEWADGTEDTTYQPAGEDEEILFGPSEGLGGPPRPQVEGTIPDSVLRRLPALARAARDPSAPPSLVAMYRLLADHLEQELRSAP